MTEQFRGVSESVASAYADESAFVKALRLGDHKAAEHLVRTHAPWMLKVARRICSDPSLAEDCVQDAFINVFRKVGEFEQRSSVKTWLHRIVVNQSLMKLRSRPQRREESIDELLPVFNEYDCRIERPYQEIPTPEEFLVRKDRRALVRRKIEELPEHYRIILTLRDLEDLPTRDVADWLGLSEANVKVRVHRARAALKKLLEPTLRGEAL